jgi:Cys-rich repeat protein
MHGLSIAAITLGSLVALFPVAFIAYLNIGGIRHVVKRSKSATSPLTCAADADCPSGYVCVNGKCLARLPR